MISGFAKRAFAMLLALIMVISLLPTTVFATEAEHDHDHDVIVEEHDHDHDHALNEGKEDPTEPTTDPAENKDPIDLDATEPVTEPVTEPTEPVTDPTEPVTDPTEPVTEPTEPAEEPELSAAAKAVQEKIDSFLMTYLGALDLSYNEVKDIVTAMDGDTLEASQDAYYALNDEGAKLTEDEAASLDHVETLSHYINVIEKMFCVTSNGLSNVSIPVANN